MAQHTTDTTVPASLRARAAERPADVAHEVVGVGKLEFGQWERRSNALARGLLERGVQQGDRIVLPCSPMSWIDYAVAYVGVQKAGAIAVPVLELHGQQHITRLIVEAGAVGVVGGPHSSADAAWALSNAELEEGQLDTPVALALGPGDDAEILFTSGTTGAPKGVVATHASVLFTHSKSKRRGGTRRVLHALPPGSLAGQGLLLQPLDMTAHTIITLPEFSNREFLAAVENYHATDVVLIPALVGSLVRFDSATVFDLSSVKVVRTMSAPIAPALLRKLDGLFPTAATVNMYTSTEAWPARTRVRYDPMRPGSVGRADRSGSIRIVNDHGDILERGMRGHVELGMDAAPRRRYLNDPEASAKVFLPDGWVRTGDIGYLDSDGYLYLVDRSSDLVISGGVNISTIEVEAAIREFQEVIDVAVVGMPHRILGEYLVAAVKVAQNFSTETFQSFLEERLGPIRSPKRVVEIEEIPRNATGKVLKNSLREQLASYLRGSRAVPSASTLEATLQRFWADALGEEAPSSNLSFIEMGGTSLGAMEVVGRVRSELKFDIKQRDVLMATNLSDFCARVLNASTVGEARSRPTRQAYRKETLNLEYGHPTVFRRNFPTTYSQRWFFYAHRGEWSKVNIPVLFQLPEAYDRTVLDLALEDLVVRHESLRTTFIRSGHGVEQLVHERGRIALEAFDGFGTEQTGEEGWVRHIQEAMYSPFYLQGGSLARARLCQVEADRHILVLSAHHTICDGWSSGVIYRDLVELYRARYERRLPRLPRLEMQLADYALWENSVDLGEYREFWKGHIGQKRPRLRIDVPFDSENGSARMRGRRCEPIPTSSAREMHTLARELGTTQARVLGAVVIASIRDYIEGTVTIGLATANRRRTEFLNVVGNLADFLPVRVEVPKSLTLRELVAAFDESVSEAYDHWLPFDSLSDMFDDRDRRRPPTDIAINYMPRPARNIEDGGVQFRRLFEDEDFHETVDIPDLVMERSDLRSDIDYTFHPQPDGSIKTTIFANVAVLSEAHVDQLAVRLSETLQLLKTSS
nr:AMP-binding protein [Phytoactinopolyspora limicola]